MLMVQIDANWGISKIYSPSRVAWWGCWSQKSPTVPVLLMELLSPGPVSMPNLFFGNGCRLHKLFATVAIGELVMENISSLHFSTWKRDGTGQAGPNGRKRLPSLHLGMSKFDPFNRSPFDKTAPQHVCVIYAGISRQNSYTHTNHTNIDRKPCWSTHN